MVHPGFNVQISDILSVRTIERAASRQAKAHIQAVGVINFYLHTVREREVFPEQSVIRKLDLRLYKPIGSVLVLQEVKTNAPFGSTTVAKVIVWQMKNCAFH